MQNKVRVKGHICRYRIMASTSASQAENAGSILVTCSKPTYQATESLNGKCCTSLTKGDSSELSSLSTSVAHKGGALSLGESYSNVRTGREGCVTGA